METISNYLKLHERLVIGTFTLAVIMFLGNKWIDHQANVADALSKQAQAVAAQQQVVVNGLMQQLQTSQQANNELQARLSADDFRLESEISSLKDQLATQQTKVKTEPLPEVTSQWNALIQIPDGIQNTASGLTITEAAARATVSNLVEVPVLQKTVDDQKTEIANKNSELMSQASVITASTALVDGLKTQIVDNKNACVREVAQVKADDRKKSRKWFLIGYGAGLATRGAIYILTGK